MAIEEVLPRWWLGVDDDFHELHHQEELDAELEYGPLPALVASQRP